MMLEFTQTLMTFNRSLCNGYSRLYCAAFLGTLPSGFPRQFIQANMAVIPQANALYQGNDQCVKTDLTAVYWGSAEALSTMAVVGLLALVSL